MHQPRRTASAQTPYRDLRRHFRGPVHLPGDHGYDDARATLNKTFDPRPLVVAEALSPADVQAAVRAAREHGLPFAVQATGHGTLVPSDGGLLLKTSRMARVLVDPDRGVAWAGPGAQWKDVITAAAPFGLAPLSGSSPTVGVAGYTLGGGIGWLARRYGFAADSLLRARLVTADGQRRVVSADRDPDLFWALRGGGGNFGVVTSLEFRLHPVPQGYGGKAYFPIENAADTLAFYRHWAATQPDELTTTLVVMQSAPEEAGVPGPVLVVRAFYAGAPQAAQRALRPLWQVAGRPLYDGFGPMTYPDVATIGGTAPTQFHLFRDLPEGVSDAVVNAAGHPQAPASAVEVRHWGGAMARPGAGAGPVGHRDVPFSIAMAGPAEAAAPLLPYATEGSFLNWLGDPARTHTAYTPVNYQRLRELKRRYDPANMFGLTHNIPPAATGQHAAPVREYAKARAA